MLELLLAGTVPSITVAELKEMDDSVVLLDIRKFEEYSVSHIPGAQHVDTDHFNINDFEKLPLDSEIVVYCSVGYRSEKVGEKFQKAGFKNVRNLYGGIFEWVNQKNIVVNRSGPVNKIHPYNLFWGIWINNETVIKYYGENR